MLTVAAWAQAPARGPVVLSPEVQADRKVTFRLLAPQATEVKLNSGDIPGNNGPGKVMTKAENGVWEATFGPP